MIPKTKIEKATEQAIQGIYYAQCQEVTDETRKDLGEVYNLNDDINRAHSELLKISEKYPVPKPGILQNILNFITQPVTLSIPQIGHLMVFSAAGATLLLKNKKTITDADLYFSLGISTLGMAIEPIGERIFGRRK